MDRISADEGDAFRSCFGSFATGVLIATCRPLGGEPIGVTVSSLSSVSLDPPLALFCLQNEIGPLAEFLNAGHFALNILRADQTDLAMHFASQRSMPEGLAIETWSSGAPILHDAMAVADCSLHDVMGGGDHKILLGRVLEVSAQEQAAPMIYFRGKFGSFT